MPERTPPPERFGSLDLAAITALAAGDRPLPLDRWNPPHCGDSAMRIDADGRWFHEGAPIVRPAMVRLFASILRREPDGGYVLVTPVEKLSIDVADLPFVAVELQSEGVGRDRRIAFRLNTDAPLVAGPAHPIEVADGPAGPRPRVRVRAGIDARIARPVYYELAALALAEGTEPAGVWSGGAFFPLDPS